MKRIIVLILFASSMAYAQTNTFPATGNVGIGTSGAGGKLDINAGTQNAIRTLTSNRYVIEVRNSASPNGGWWLSNDPNGSFAIAENSGSIDRFNITSGGKVGIGTITPQKALDVISGANDYVSFGQQMALGSYSGIHFGYLEAGNLSFRKSALVFERTDGAARGKIHFLNNNGNNSNSAGLADSKMTIDFSGNVGLGTTSPLYPLHVISPAGNTGLRIGATGLSTEVALHVALGNYGYLGLGGNTALRGNGASSMFEGNVGIAEANPITKLHINIASANTNFGAVAVADLGLFLKNTNATNNNFNSISFGDAGGYGVAHIGTIYSDQTNHFGKLFFATKGSGVLTQRMLIDENGNIGIGTTSPSIWFGGSKTLEFSDARPVLKLSSISPTGLSTIAFTNTAVNQTSHLGEFHLNYQFDQVNNDKSLLRFSTYPAGDALVLQSNGNIGMGTAAPNYKLDVNGTINASSILINGQPFAGGGSQWATSANTINYMAGNIGIGTTTPDAKLAVKGQIHAQEVKVDLLGSIAPPDYVFASNYQLPTLDYIKTYIDQNKHLPEVPSAKDMEANGVNLGEMNMLLLKKIEELTLYQIEANRKIELLQAEIQKINNKN